MPINKFSTESAEAFASAVNRGEEEHPDHPKSMAQRLEPDPVSWSDSENVEMADEVALMGVDSGGPDIKMAKLADAVNGLEGRHANLVKEAISFSKGSLARKAGRGAWNAAKATGKGTFRAGKATGKTLGKMTAGTAKGVRNTGRASRKALRNRGHDLSVTPQNAAGRVGTEGGFQTWHANQYRR